MDESPLERKTTGCRLAHLETLEKIWWERFRNEVFDCLLQLSKGWNKPVENLQVSDVILIHYDGKSKAGDWRWGCVTRADPDQDGLVRLVLVRYTILGRAGCIA